MLGIREFGLSVVLILYLKDSKKADPETFTSYTLQKKNRWETLYN